MGKWYQFVGPRDPVSGVERLVLEYGGNAEPARFLDKGGAPLELEDEEFEALFGVNDLVEVEAPVEPGQQQAEPQAQQTRARKAPNTEEVS